MNSIVLIYANKQLINELIEILNIERMHTGAELNFVKFI